MARIIRIEGYCLVLLSLVTLSLSRPEHYDLNLLKDSSKEDFDYQIVTPNTKNQTELYITNDGLHQSDGLQVARAQAIMSFMEKIMIALGPEFQKGLPKAPSNGTLMPTVFTPLSDQETRDYCPEHFAKCSSQAYYPSCVLPNKTDPNLWNQKLNIFFDLTEDLTKEEITVLNATLRLYKNYSLPEPSSITIKLHSYSKSLTKRRDDRVLVTSTEVSSDYIGWVWLDVGDYLHELKPKHNHGFLITVHDSKNFTWFAPAIFVTMDCGSGNDPNLKAFPFEVPSNDSTNKFPSLNVVTGFVKPTRDLKYIIPTSSRIHEPLNHNSTLKGNHTTTNTELHPIERHNHTHKHHIPTNSLSYDKFESMHMPETHRIRKFSPENRFTEISSVAEDLKTHKPRHALNTKMGAGHPVQSFDLPRSHHSRKHNRKPGSKSIKKNKKRKNIRKYSD